MKINKILVVSLVSILFLFTNKVFSNNEFNFKQEILKFVPYEKLDTLLSNNKKLVYMPYRELKKLILEKSAPAPQAPVDYVIKNLSLEGTIKDGYVAFTGDYQIDLVNKNWAKIPVLSTDTALKQAVFDEKTAKLINYNNFFNVISDEVGEHSLKLKFDVGTQKSGNTNRVSFSIPNASVTNIRVNEAPDLNIDNVNGKVAIKWKNGTTQIQPTVNKTKPEKIDNRPPKIVASVNTLISLDEGLLQGFSDYSFKIYHNGIEKLAFRIPEGIEVLDVSSPQNIINKGSQKIAGNVLTVYLKSKVKDDINLNISYEKTFENKKTELHIPAIIPVGKEINKVSGYLALQTAGNSEIKPVKTENISRIDLGDLPRKLESLAEYPIIAAYSFLKGEYSLSMEVIPHKDAPVQVAMIDQVRADSRLSFNGVMTSKIDYSIRNMSEQFFRFNLPENAEILYSAINRAPQQIEKQDSGDARNTVYLVNIKKYQDSSPFNLTIIYRQKFKLNNLFIFRDLQLPQVINMAALTTSWAVYLPENLHYWNFTGLSKGNNNYLRYLPRVNSLKDSSKRNIQTQIASNYYAEDEAASPGKVTGILPPEFTMPPVKNLKRHDFSGYLTGTAPVDILIVGITKLIYLLVILLIGYLVWKNQLYRFK